MPGCKSLSSRRAESTSLTDDSNSVSGRGEQGSGVGGRGVHLSPQIHQEYAFRHSSACRTPAESRQEDLTSGKEYTEPHKTGSDEGTRGKNRVLAGPDLPSVGGGTEAGVRSPRRGNCQSQRNF